MNNYTAHPHYRPGFVYRIGTKLFEVVARFGDIILSEELDQQIDALRRYEGELIPSEEITLYCADVRTFVC